MGPAYNYRDRAERSSSSQIRTANIFSALIENTSKKQPPKVTQQEHKAVPTMPTWTPEPVRRSWADYEDEDDDEFFANFSPLPRLPPLKLETLKEEEEKEEEEEEEEEEGPKLPVPIKPLKVAAPLQQILTKKEQRKRELAELDSALAELGLSSALTAKQWEKKEKEDEQRRLSRELSEKPKGASTIQTSNKPKTENPLAKDMHGEEVQRVVDHEALRKAAATSAHRNKNCTATSSGPCKAVAAEASARAAKVATAKKKERSKYYYTSR